MEVTTLLTPPNTQTKHRRAWESARSLGNPVKAQVERVGKAWHGCSHYKHLRYSALNLVLESFPQDKDLLGQKTSSHSKGITDAAWPSPGLPSLGLLLSEPCLLDCPLHSPHSVSLACVGFVLLRCMDILEVCVYLTSKVKKNQNI